MAVTIERIENTQDQIGEGPVWDGAEGALYRIDAERGEIFRLQPSTGSVRSWKVEPARHVGSFALRKGGGAVLATNHGLELFDFDSGQLTPITYPEGKLPNTRFNDGKVDSRGRFVVGEINLKSETVGRFYRLDPDLKCTRLGEGVACFNGPCFSPDGRVLYYSDTMADAIFACDYDPASGAVSNRRIFAKTAEFNGSPDGCTVDAEGRVWSALMRSGQVGCFTPEGKLERLVKVPPKHVSSTMFGGEKLDELYITSIGSALGGMLQPNEADGGLYVIRGLGVKGKPEPRFAG
ncbi:MAG TPA: SMP-30/gluconolactonase/LRE family protein [Candidatus Binataceae bacterium]